MTPITILFSGLTLIAILITMLARQVSWLMEEDRTESYLMILLFALAATFSHAVNASLVGTIVFALIAFFCAMLAAKNYGAGKHQGQTP